MGHGEPAPAKLAVSATCRDCGYRLDGLAAAGRCPECGTEYPPVGGVHVKPPMSAGRMCLLLGWPLGLVLLGVIVLLLMLATRSQAMDGIGWTLLGFGAILSLVNGPVKFAYLCLDHAKIGRRIGSPTAHLPMPQKLAVLAALVTPLAVVGFAALLIAKLV